MGLLSSGSIVVGLTGNGRAKPSLINYGNSSRNFKRSTHLKMSPHGRKLATPCVSIIIFGNVPAPYLTIYDQKLASRQRGTLICGKLNRLRSDEMVIGKNQY